MITTHEPANHDSYGYVFTVDNKSYTGSQSPKANELAIGKKITVYYDPQNPRKNALTDFRDLSADDLGPVPLLLLGIGAVALFIRHRRRKTMAARKY